MFYFLKFTVGPFRKCSDVIYMALSYKALPTYEDPFGMLIEILL